MVKGEEMNYTKGEWKANRTVVDCDGWPIAQTYPDTRLNSNDSLSLMQANAHLIAAAPELLQEAKTAYERFPTSGLRAAIAKAEGKGGPNG